MTYNVSQSADKFFVERFNIPFNIITYYLSENLNYHWEKKINILDFGCGVGITALRFAFEFPSANIYGIDIVDDFKRLEKLTKKNLSNSYIAKNINFQTFNQHNLPFENNLFDFIYSWSVFEHIERQYLKQSIRNLWNILKNDGIIFVQINPLYYSSRGAHLYNYIQTPWIHLIEQHDSLIKILKSKNIKEKTGIKDDIIFNNKINYTINQYQALNKITSTELIELFCEEGFICIFQDRKHESLIPPKRLLMIYNYEILTNNQIIAIFKKK